jgi:hypothetical protein
MFLRNREANDFPIGFTAAVVNPHLGSGLQRGDSRADAWRLRSLASHHRD